MSWKDFGQGVKDYGPTALGAVKVLYDIFSGNSSDDEQLKFAREKFAAEERHRREAEERERQLQAKRYAAHKQRKSLREERDAKQRAKRDEYIKGKLGSFHEEGERRLNDPVGYRQDMQRKFRESPGGVGLDKDRLLLNHPEVGSMGGYGENQWKRAYDFSLEDFIDDYSNVQKEEEQRILMRLLDELGLEDTAYEGGLEDILGELGLASDEFQSWEARDRQGVQSQKELLEAQSRIGEARAGRRRDESDDIYDWLDKELGFENDRKADAFDERMQYARAARSGRDKDEYIMNPYRDPKRKKRPLENIIDKMSNYGRREEAPAGNYQ